MDFSGGDNEGGGVSIIILGLDVPESCSKCWLGDGIVCSITGMYVGEESSTQRASFCPIRPYAEWDVTCDPEYRESHFQKDEWGE